MKRGRLLLAGALAAVAIASAPSKSSGASVELVVLDAEGRPMDLARLTAHIGRADRQGPLAIWATTLDGRGGFRPKVTQKGSSIALSWDRPPRVALSLPWPVAEDGFSTVLIDRGGQGLVDGDVIRLNEEIALTQYRLFKEAWQKRLKDLAPPYKPGSEARKLFDRARDSLAAAQAIEDPAQRSRRFDAALGDVSIGWEKLLHEHGRQIAAADRPRNRLRFGLTLDENLLRRLDHYQDIIESVRHSGSDWVRLVFRPNPADFTYAKQSSFNEYDAIVRDLRESGLRVMGCVLDTSQWPSSLTPEIYAARARHLALQYKGSIESWEVGSEINGNWLGGRRQPLTPSSVFLIFSAGVSAVRKVDASLEIVATLYWWEGTAPDESFTLSGWLLKYGAALADKVDVVALSLQPEDNPVGMAFERIFDLARAALPGKKLMLGSFGYVEGERLRGYWWLHPEDVDGARKDLVILYTAAACAITDSLGGGFWWQTLDQMIPGRRKATDLFRVYKRTLQQLN